MIPSLLLLQTEILERQEVRIALRRDGPALFLGAILAVAGILTITLYLARHRKSEKVLLWFGLFTAAYGVRLMLETDIFQFTFDPVPRVTWAWPIAIVTYVFPLLVSLFLLELFPNGTASDGGSSGVGAPGPSSVSAPICCCSVPGRSR
jgi:hypothetical protein